jgi:glycosyltransferase involved in cell wall biosynthesis
VVSNMSATAVSKHKNKGLVSVIVPAYNRVSFLREALESVRMQTLSALCGCDVPPAVEWELVVVN